ncbi:Uncharacterised protein [Mycobacteroides abscessus subsp. massiliense]|nr:Uncharacterised protein [Mycobacteroides abscessus subsp. massiliense]
MPNIDSASTLRSSRGTCLLKPSQAMRNTDQTCLKIDGATRMRYQGSSATAS